MNANIATLQECVDKWCYEHKCTVINNDGTVNFREESAQPTANCVGGAAQRK